MSATTWNPATDREVDPAVRARIRAAQMSIGHVSNHVYRKWAERAPEHAAVDVVEAWEEGHPVDFPHTHRGAVVRWHAPTDMILIARQGALMSCYPLSNRPWNERRYVRQQVRE